MGSSTAQTLQRKKKLDDRETWILSLPNILQARNFGNFQLGYPYRSRKVFSSYSV
jgi:hypothetical protein